VTWRCSDEDPNIRCKDLAHSSGYDVGGMLLWATAVSLVFGTLSILRQSQGIGRAVPTGFATAHGVVRAPCADRLS
jgi:hypothetical protein